MVKTKSAWVLALMFRDYRQKSGMYRVRISLEDGAKEVEAFYSESHGMFNASPECNYHEWLSFPPMATVLISLP